MIGSVAQTPEPPLDGALNITNERSLEFWAAWITRSWNTRMSQRHEA